MGNLIQRSKRAYDAADRAYKRGFNRVLYSCRDMTELASLSMDRKLGWSQKVRRGLHLMICRWCRRYARQMGFLRDQVRRYSERFPDEGEDRLSDAAKQRLIDRTKDSGEKNP